MQHHMRNILLPALCIAAGYFFYGCRHTDKMEQDVVYYDTIQPPKPKYDKDTIPYSELKTCHVDNGYEMDDFLQVAKDTLYFDLCEDPDIKRVIVVMPGEKYLPPPPPPVEIEMDKINIEDLRFKK